MFKIALLSLISSFRQTNHVLLILFYVAFLAWIFYISPGFYVSSILLFCLSFSIRNLSMIWSINDRERGLLAITTTLSIFMFENSMLVVVGKFILLSLCQNLSNCNHYRSLIWLNFENDFLAWFIFMPILSLWHFLQKLLPI